MQSPQDFSKQLIKGKIAEMIFDQMFRRVGDYTVIPFGYEAIIPELMQYTQQADRHDLIENISSAPDFALVSHDPKEVMLVEVKYRHKISISEIKETAKKICDRWKLVYLFVATPEGFYLDACNDIETREMLTPLTARIVPEQIQAEYLAILKGFIA